MIGVWLGECLKALRGVYLSDELLVHSPVGIGAVERLLEKGEKHGNDDDRLQGLTKDDEENRHGKDVDRHDGGESEVRRSNTQVGLRPLQRGRELRLGWGQHKTASTLLLLTPTRATFEPGASQTSEKVLMGEGGGEGGGSDYAERSD